ncbi:MAG: tRNA uridine-5-carboxymethylaminomethyl(34) synthesis enzyme MnmG, partial [Acidaminococcaceae bacterium]
LPVLPAVVAEQIEIHAKYEGYIAKQKLEVERALKLEHKLIPPGLDYHSIKELSIEAIEKLQKVSPLSIGQASRISGVSPADVGVLMIYLEALRRKGSEA